MAKKSSSKKSVGKTKRAITDTIQTFGSIFGLLSGVVVAINYLQERYVTNDKHVKDREAIYKQIDDIKKSHWLGEVGYINVRVSTPGSALHQTVGYQDLSDPISDNTSHKKSNEEFDFTLTKPQKDITHLLPVQPNCTVKAAWVTPWSQLSEEKGMIFKVEASVKNGKLLFTAHANTKLDSAGTPVEDTPVSGCIVYRVYYIFTTMP
jgi:hypothetical protein